jgi:hypothetical protein
MADCVFSSAARRHTYLKLHRPFFKKEEGEKKKKKKKPEMNGAF